MKKLLTLLAACLVAMSHAYALDSITFHAEQAYPESVSWSPRQNAFFVGSMRNGTIAKVSAEGKYKIFASHPAMFGSGGIKYDAKRNWVWAAMCDIGIATGSSQRTQGKTAAVIAFDGTTGKFKRYINLAPLLEGGHCANDLAFDPAGNIYVTDSFAPVVYVIDRHFRPGILVRSEDFQGENFNLNGIAYHPDGYLLVGKHNSGDVFRLSLKPNPVVQTVALSDKVPGADGFALVGKNSLVVAQNGGKDRAVLLTTSDNWHSAAVKEIAKSAATFPTAITIQENAVYMLNNRIDTLFDPSAQRVSDYILQRLPIEAGK